jgi:hypothetical protein
MKFVHELSYLVDCSNLIVWQVSDIIGPEHISLSKFCWLGYASSAEEPLPCIDVFQVFLVSGIEPVKDLSSLGSRKPE